MDAEGWQVMEISREDTIRDVLEASDGEGRVFAHFEPEKRRPNRCSGSGLEAPYVVQYYFGNPRLTCPECRRDVGTVQRADGRWQIAYHVPPEKGQQPKGHVSCPGSFMQPHAGLGWAWTEGFELRNVGSGYEPSYRLRCPFCRRDVEVVRARKFLDERYAAVEHPRMADEPQAFGSGPEGQASR
jgi:hypothetical protein